MITSENIDSSAKEEIAVDQDELIVFHKKIAVMRFQSFEQALVETVFEAFKQFPGLFKGCFDTNDTKR